MFEDDRYIMKAIQLEEYAHPESQYNLCLLDSIKQESGKFYHYTNIDACRSILDREEKSYYELWASHLAYSNDTQEYKNGLELINERLEKKFKDIQIPDDILNNFRIDINRKLTGLSDLDTDVYIICFSMADDLLTQWKYYGKQCGASIQFNLNDCKYSGFICDYDKKIEIKAIGPYRVIYNDDEKNKIIDEIIENVIAGYNSDVDEDKERKVISNLGKLFAICPLFKHKDFVDENECRLIIRPIYDQSDKSFSKLFNYRMRNGVLLPYLKIRLHPDGNKLDLNNPIISSITIGPGENQELIKNSIRHFVARKNLDIDPLTINHSNIPFRS